MHTESAFRQDFLNLAGEALAYARTLLEKDGYFAPVVLEIRDGRVTPVTIEGNVKDEHIHVIHKLARSGAKALVFITDALVADVKDDVRVMRDVPEADKVDALLCVAYTPTSTDVRRLCYRKSGEGKFTFFDLGWEKGFRMEPSSKLSNPYTNGG